MTCAYKKIGGSWYPGCRHTKRQGPIRVDEPPRFGDYCPWCGDKAGGRQLAKAQGK